MHDRKHRQGMGLITGDGYPIDLVGDSISLPLLLTCRRWYAKTLI